VSIFSVLRLRCVPARPIPAPSLCVVAGVHSRAAGGRRERVEWNGTAKGARGGHTPPLERRQAGVLA
jgi:hypothetical protein